MKAIVLAIPLAFACNACAAPMQPTPEVPVQSAEEAALVEAQAAPATESILPVVSPSPEGETVLHVGQVLEIILQGNASTGYLWEFLSEGTPQLRRVVPPAPPAASAPPATAAASDPSLRPMVGSPRQFRWQFEAVQPGTTEIRMVYWRPWEKNNAPAQVAVFEVVVHEPAR